jgi:hypothetical protein
MEGRKIISLLSHLVYIIDNISFSVCNSTVLLEGAPLCNCKKLLPCDHEVVGSSSGNSFLQKCRKRLHNKTQSGRTLLRIMRKRELRAPGCPP